MPTLIEPGRQAGTLTPEEIGAIFGSHEAFLSTVFGEDLWLKQRQITNAIDQYDAVAVKACHSSGKTRVAAGIGCSFLARHDDGIVITTAPTAKQVEKLLWGEVHALVKRARGVRFPVPLLTEMRVNEKNYMLGFSTNDSVNFQGWHSENLLIILDEAPGIDPSIYDAIAGIEAGGRVRVLQLGNPVVGVGRFYDAFTKERKFWQLFTISAFDTPNLAGCYWDDGDVRLPMRLPPPPGHDPVNLAEIEDEHDPRLAYAPRPYLTTRKWVWKMARKWGVRSDRFQSRVLGKFPSSAPDALVGLAEVEDALEAAPVLIGEPLDIGIDVAGPGECDTVLYALKGDVVVDRQAWPGGQCEGDVVAAVRRCERQFAGGAPARHVGVDTINGHHFANTIEAAGIPVTRINVALPAVGREDGTLATTIYLNQRAQRYWRLAERFRHRRLHNLQLAEARSEAVVQQLTSMRWLPATRQGKMQLESKEEMRKRGLPSPDDAEALMLAQYLPELDRHRAQARAMTGSVSYAH